MARKIAELIAKRRLTQAASPDSARQAAAERQNG